MTPEPGPPISGRLYRLLLRLYPRGQRDGFAEAQAEAFEDWLSEARHDRGLAGVARVWGLAAADWAWSMLLAHGDATTPREALRLANYLFLTISLAMWGLVGASMVGRLAWATDIVETHSTRNTWIALGCPCAAVALAALTNPWRARRLTLLLSVSTLVCVSAWFLVLSAWRA